MSVNLRVPRKQAEDPNTGTLFPEGDWLVEIEEVRITDAPEFMTRPPSDPTKKYQVRHKENEQLSIQLGNPVALGEHQDDPGRLKNFVNFVIRDGTEDVLSVTEGSDVGWRIRSDGRRITNLALALGMIVEHEDGTVSPVENLIDMFRNGTVKGMKVGMTVEHSSWQSGSKSGINVNTKFFQAAG